MSSRDPCRVVSAAVARNASKDLVAQATNTDASPIVSNAKPGARVTPSLSTTAAQPPASVINWAPLEYDATNAASVVASGT
jgi:hypothetical protein